MQSMDAAELPSYYLNYLSAYYLSKTREMCVGMALSLLSAVDESSWREPSSPDYS